MRQTSNFKALLGFLFLFAFSIIGCSTTGKNSSSENIPFLLQEELIRPYNMLGRIQITREVIGTDYSLSPDIKSWGFSAIRQEADKMGADAVILPEITGHSIKYGPVPSTEYRATGFAIKFK